MRQETEYNGIWGFKQYDAMIITLVRYPGFIYFHRNADMGLRNKWALSCKPSSVISLPRWTS